MPLICSWVFVSINADPNIILNNINTILTNMHLNNPFYHVATTAHN